LHQTIQDFVGSPVTPNGYYSSYPIHGSLPGQLDGVTWTLGHYNIEFEGIESRQVLDLRLGQFARTLASDGIDDEPGEIIHYGHTSGIL
jgi:hypothetical protein